MSIANTASRVLFSAALSTNAPTATTRPSAPATADQILVSRRAHTTLPAAAIRAIAPSTSTSQSPPGSAMAKSALVPPPSTLGGTNPTKRARPASAGCTATCASPIVRTVPIHGEHAASASSAILTATRTA